LKHVHATNTELDIHVRFMNIQTDGRFGLQIKALVGEIHFTQGAVARPRVIPDSRESARSDKIIVHRQRTFNWSGGLSCLCRQRQ
jgi:hypothetical protein